jgi:tetratricopeptide (TPR) repeat protein
MQSEFDKLLTDAVAHHTSGRLSEAEAGYLTALQIFPTHAAIMHNLGVLAASGGDHLLAIEWFENAIAVEPRYFSAHYNRAIALEALGRRQEAIRSFTCASAIEPEDYGSHRALGLLWLAEGERGRALDHFARTYELRRGEDRTGIADQSLTRATRGKLLHDADQFRHIGRNRRDGQRFETMAKTYESMARNFPLTATQLSESDAISLGEDYNTAIYLCAAPEIAGGAVSARTDRDELVRRFHDGPTGAIYFDGLLRPEALAALRRFLLQSTIWHDFSHIGGFVASYLEDGLACPLVLQMADELRATFPELIGKHPLSQAWAFKGLEQTAAVDVHADDAAVSVNFWVTPTEANLNPGRGGLAVCRVPPPSDWRIRGYDTDSERIVAFLAQNADDSLMVPYRENRAVLFESRLFHHSDVPEFADGYENRRINVTLLFGAPGGRPGLARLR